MNVWDSSTLADVIRRWKLCTHMAAHVFVVWFSKSAHLLLGFFWTSWVKLCLDDNELAGSIFALILVCVRAAHHANLPPTPSLFTSPTLTLSPFQTPTIRTLWAHFDAKQVPVDNWHSYLIVCKFSLFVSLYWFEYNKNVWRVFVERCFRIPKVCIRISEFQWLMCIFWRVVKVVNGSPLAAVWPQPRHYL